MNTSEIAQLPHVEAALSYIEPMTGASRVVDLLGGWFYASAMREDEAMLSKCFDSAEDGRARFVPHSAFVDPTTPVGASPRESIELRTLVFFGQ